MFFVFPLFFVFPFFLYFDKQACLVLRTTKASILMANSGRETDSNRPETHQEVISYVLGFMSTFNRFLNPNNDFGATQPSAASAAAAIPFIGVYKDDDDMGHGKDSPFHAVWAIMVLWVRVRSVAWTWTGPDTPPPPPPRAK